ncbi:MAG: lyase family protein, partial [Gammaproteobacteria bacterium]|nr:lyase family protein [Gammaproteobacteria bacterium]
MELSSLTAISPVDGRYASKSKDLREYFSEFGLIKHRVEVEIRWLLLLADCSDIEEVPSFSDKARKHLTRIMDQFSVDDAQKIKEIERFTNHDVKAVEYFLKEAIKSNKELNRVTEFL